MMLGVSQTCVCVCVSEALPGTEVSDESVLGLTSDKAVLTKCQTGCKLLQIHSRFICGIRMCESSVSILLHCRAF